MAADPADPSQLRYWDGHAWTEHRAPRQELAVAGATSAPQVDAVGWWRRLRKARQVGLLAALGGLALAAVVVAAVAADSGSGESADECDPGVPVGCTWMDYGRTSANDVLDEWKTRSQYEDPPFDERLIQDRIQFCELEVLSLHESEVPAEWEDYFLNGCSLQVAENQEALN